VNKLDLEIISKRIGSAVEFLTQRNIDEISELKERVGNFENKIMHLETNIMV
jgi:hypothetical protein